MFDVFVLVPFGLSDDFFQGTDFSFPTHLLCFSRVISIVELFLTDSFCGVTGKGDFRFTLVAVKFVMFDMLLVSFLNPAVIFV